MPLCHCTRSPAFFAGGGGAIDKACPLDLINDMGPAKFPVRLCAWSLPEGVNSINYHFLLFPDF